MRSLRIVFVAAMFATPVRARGDQWYAPRPHYPAEAKATRVGGIARIRMTVDDKGNITKAEVVRSSGSPLLDEYTARFVKAYWKAPAGHPLVHTTEFDYRPSSRPMMTYSMPTPGYPFGRSEGYTGRTCTVRVDFAEWGAVSRVIMIRSTGSKVLDEHTLDFITKNWRSSVGRESTREMDIAFGAPSTKPTRKEPAR